MGKLASMIIEDFPSHSARELVVPEWGMTLYVFPLTIGQFNSINREEGDAMAAARTIVVRGKAADGSPMFDEDDYQKLISHARGSRFGPQVTARVAREIMADNTLEGDVEEAIEAEEKN